MKSAFYPKFLGALALLAFAVVSGARAEERPGIPGPDDQGGMITPLVLLSGNTLSVIFTPPASAPVLNSLNTWSPGDTFSPDASWYGALDPVGGDGALFNNQYGFTFLGSIPSGSALGIRLVSVSSSELKFWNYVLGQNRFDQVLDAPNDQILWNGSTWNNYVTLPDTAADGYYTATFEIFIANANFTTGTGFVDYSPGALSAVRDFNYDTATITYSWQVETGMIPEPVSALWMGLAGLCLGLAWRRRRGTGQLEG